MRSKIHSTNVTVTFRGEVAHIAGELHMVRIGLHLWPTMLPDDYEPRPSIGQHIQAISVPTSPNGPHISEAYPLEIVGWSPERKPSTDSNKTAAQTGRDTLH